VSPRNIAALFLRHRIAVIFTALVAGVLSFQLIHANPGYMDSGGVMFTAPKSSGNLFQNMQSLRVAEETVAAYMMGPQGEQQVRAAGGTASYNVAMLNTYNEDFPGRPSARSSASFAGRRRCSRRESAPPGRMRCRRPLSPCPPGR
jgi:hypothetical protein